MPGGMRKQTLTGGRLSRWARFKRIWLRRG
jgi:hypothetical protein